MPPPPAASPLSECGDCLLIMICLAFIAGLFIVVSAILCERVFWGSLPPDARRVPPVWRQGGTLWIEPTQSHEQPEVLLNPSEAAPLWIQRTHNWFLDTAPAELRSCTSTEDLQRGSRSPSSSTPLWDHDEPTWGVQPRVTLRDLEGFFQHSHRHT